MRKLTLLILLIILIGCHQEEYSPNTANSTAPLVTGNEPPVVIVEPDPTTDTTTDIPIIVDPTSDITADIPPEIIQVDPTPDVQPDPEPEPDVPPEPEPIPDTQPPPPPPIIIPDFTVRIADSLYFSEPYQMRLWKSGNIEKASPGIYAVENDLITLDTNGNELSIITLITPIIGAFRTKIKSTENGVYYCVEYPPALSSTLGGRSSTYSEFYKDNTIISTWYLNRFSCDKVLSVGPEVFVLDTAGSHHTIDGASTLVNYVLDNVFYRHDLNIGGKYMRFNNFLEFYNLNYALNADQWINFEGLNYSENGYTWSADTRFIENATVMHAWNIKPYPVNPELPNAQAPILLSAGISAGKLYWIECNSGYVFEYDPALDTLTQKWKIYLGDGMRDTGILKRESLHPHIFGGKLYFSNDSAIYSLGLETGFINIFYAGSGVVEGF